MDSLITMILINTGIDMLSSILIGQSYNKNDTMALRETILDSSSRIQKLLTDSTSHIINKIESDKLEELQSRISNLAMLVRLGKMDDILPYCLTVRESVDYAQNRVNEDKWHWLGPCLMGKSMILAAFELCSLNTEVERLELKAFLVKSKHGLLDMIIPKMLADNGKLPWGKIQQFLVEDVSNNFIHDFLPKSIPMHTKPMPMQNRAGYCPFCQRELNSLRAKQCLRCHKSWHGQN